MIRDRLKKLLGRDKKPASTPAAPAPAAPAPKIEGNLAKEGDRPWYLDGQADVDGWDATDVKKG